MNAPMIDSAGLSAASLPMIRQLVSFNKPILEIDDIEEYNQKEGLSLSIEEIEYLQRLTHKIGRKLTDSEIFAFSQANSEHCRHKIFNGTFIIDGVEQPTSLFKLIKKPQKQIPTILFLPTKIM